MIPTDWTLEPLHGVLRKPIQYGIVQTGDNIKGGIPCVRVVDMTKPDLDISEMISTSLVINKKNRKTILEKGEVLFALRGEIGKVAKVDDELAGANITRGVARLSPNFTKITTDYLMIALEAPITREDLLRRVNGSALQEIPLTQLKKISIHLPPTIEQQAITTVLHKWNVTCRLTERLIAAKQERRTWLMQQLLTGKRRLPGIDGEWRNVHLGDIFTNRVESNFPDLPLVAITGSGGVVSREDLVRRDTSSEDKSKYLRIYPGDIGYNTMRMWQGVCGLSQLEGIVSPAYTIVTPKAEIDGEFMALLFKSLPVIHLFHRHSQGLVDDTLNLKWRHFSEIKVTIPEKDEQQAIAAVFRTADRELDLLRAQLDALREQKKGLMQLLLTGKLRVVGI